MRRSPPLRDSLGAFLLFQAFAVLLASPALLSPDPVFLGHPESDLHKHLWGHWLVASSLRDTMAWPLFTHLHNFPWGGTLFVIDPFNCLACTLLELWLPAHVAFNLLVVVQLGFGGWGAWRLAWHVTEDSAASLACGAIYGFSPWVLAYTVSSGVSETLGLAWIPLSALAVLRLLGRASWKDAVWAGFVLIMAGLNTWYFLLFSLILGGVLAALSLVAGKDDTWLPRPTWRFVPHVGLALALAFAGLFPLVTLFRASFDAASSLEPAMDQRVMYTTSLERQVDFFTVSDFVLPGKDRLRVTRVLEQLAQTPYVGLVALLLAAFGLARGGRAGVTWACLGGSFFLLSLGPAIGFTRGWHSGLPTNFLFTLMFNVLGFWLISAPFRIHILTMLCVGILAATGLSRLAPRRVGVGILVASAVLAEVCFLSPTPMPLPVTPVPQAQACTGLRLDQTTGVLDIPPIRFQSELTPSEYYYQQTLHGGGIPYSTGGIFDDRLRTNGFFVEMWRLANGIFPPTRHPLDAGRGLEELALFGYRYVVLHGDLLPPRQFRYARDLLTFWVGPPSVIHDSTLRFDLAPTRLPPSNPGAAPGTPTRGEGPSPASP